MVTPWRAQSFWAAKAGNSPEEYEDAFALGIEAGRFAVADGATESLFAKGWAQLLTNGFAIDSIHLARIRRRENKQTYLSEWLVPLQKAWHEGIDWNTLPWFAEEKARNGAFATFLSLELSDSLRRWQAIAVGDSALFLVRDDRLKTAFPLSHADKFGSTAALLCSNQARNHTVWKQIRVKRGDWRSGDLFLLCTDALAQWFLIEWAAGAKPWSVLRDLNTQEEFEKLALQLRSGKSVRNDDMTVLVINVG